MAEYINLSLRCTVSNIFIDSEKRVDLMKVMGHEMIMPKFSYILDFASQILDLVTFSPFFLTNFGQFFSSDCLWSMQESIHYETHWLNKDWDEFFDFGVKINLGGISKDTALNTICMYMYYLNIQKQ